MTRFLLGLLAGAAAAGVVWAVCRSTGWALLIGLCVAVLAWVGHRIVPDLLDAIGDLF
ncbi:hypothetical protein [Streptomyces sp. NPDC051994]|uniref:hypothetical protein n=1 Tax=unclassified Streptomyces TaxID=2593676 RepID=UPI00342D044A